MIPLLAFVLKVRNSFLFQFLFLAVLSTVSGTKYILNKLLCTPQSEFLRLFQTSRVSRFTHSFFYSFMCSKYLLFPYCVSVQETLFGVSAPLTLTLLSEDPHSRGVGLQRSWTHPMDLGLTCPGLITSFKQGPLDSVPMKVIAS